MLAEGSLDGGCGKEMKERRDQPAEGFAGARGRPRLQAKEKVSVVNQGGY